MQHSNRTKVSIRWTQGTKGYPPTQLFTSTSDGIHTISPAPRSTKANHRIRATCHEVLFFWERVCHEVLTAPHVWCRKESRTKSLHLLLRVFICKMMDFLIFFPKVLVHQHDSRAIYFGLTKSPRPHRCWWVYHLPLKEIALLMRFIGPSTSWIQSSTSSNHLSVFFLFKWWKNYFHAPSLKGIQLNLINFMATYIKI